MDLIHLFPASLMACAVMLCVSALHDARRHPLAEARIQPTGTRSVRP